MPSLPFIVNDLAELANVIDVHADRLCGYAKKHRKARLWGPTERCTGAAEEARRIADMLRHTIIEGKTK